MPNSILQHAQALFSMCKDRPETQRPALHNIIQAVSVPVRLQQQRRHDLIKTGFLPGQFVFVDEFPGGYKLLLGPAVVPCVWFRFPALWAPA